MASVTIIIRTDFYVVNRVGTILFSSNERRLAFRKAKGLATRYGDVSVQRVTVLEDRETVRRVRAPTEQVAA